MWARTLRTYSSQTSCQALKHRMTHIIKRVYGPYTRFIKLFLQFRSRRETSVLISDLHEFFIHVVSIWIIWYDSFKWLLIQHRSVKISFWFSSFWGNVDSRLNLKMITWLILFDSDSWMITNKWLLLIDHKSILLANGFATSNWLQALNEYS